MNFQSVESMQSVVNVVNEAAAALNDKRRTIRESAIPDAVTGIGEKVFITDRPAAEQKAMKDFVVIRLPQTIQDKGSTYQDTYCQINVFAHDRSNGIENTVRLDEMQMEVVSKFPIVTELFSAVSPRLLPGGNDGLGFHSLIIQAKLIINK